MKKIQNTTVKSKLGIEYTVTNSKAKELIDKYDCKWIGGDEIKEDIVELDKEDEPVDSIDELDVPVVDPDEVAPVKRTRRTKAQIEADKNK